MAEPKKRAGGTRSGAKGGGRVTPAEKARRAAQAQEATGTATLQTGESLADVRAAIEEARKAAEAGRTTGGPEAGGATVTSIAELRARAMGELLRMPSGLVARVRRPGMIALLQGGVIPNSLLPLVEKGLEAGAHGQTISREEIAKGIDPTMITEMMELFDVITAFVVAEPRLRPNPQKCDACGSIKDMVSTGPDAGHEHEWRELPEHEWPVKHPTTGEELAYVAWVPFEDKEFIFNFAVGGTRDVERFQQDKQAASVEPV